MSSEYVAPSEVADDPDPVHRADSRSLPHLLRTHFPKLRLGGYSLAVVSVLLAFLLRFLLDPWLGNESRYVVFVVAVAFTGLYAGLRPALLAAALGAGVAYFCFVPPRYRWGFAGRRDAVGFGVYVLAVAAVILLTRARISAAERAEHSLKSQVEAERRLLDAETLFRRFMDNSSVCSYLRDEDGRCVYANEAAKRDFGIGPNQFENGVRQDAPGSEFREQDREVLNAGRALEFLDRGGPGGERYWLTGKFPFVDQSGRRFVGGVSLEITDRMRAEELLRKTERLSSAGQMASILSHEINNPLAALTNLIFLLEQAPLASPEREFVSQAGNMLNRINRIAGMTMACYFEERSLESLHIGRVVGEVAEGLSAKQSFRNIHVVREFNSDAILVASPFHIRQSLANLITNALESSAQTVRIRVSDGRQWRGSRRKGVRITIADDGRGIPPELRERIFEPFFSTKSENGAGLGLWVSRAFVLRNGGTLQLRSAVSGPKKGTCVSVFLPVPAAAFRAPAQAEAKFASAVGDLPAAVPQEKG